MTRHVIILCCLLAVAGCAVQKTPLTVGGSRSDGIVKMSFERADYELAQVDWEAARLKAAARCQRWGFKDARPFEAVEQECLMMTKFGCGRFRVTRTFQCE